MCNSPEYIQYFPEFLETIRYITLVNFEPTTFAINFFFFYEGTKNKVPDSKRVPVGLRKMEKVGLYNVIFELDLSDITYDFTKFTMDDMCALLLKWITWCHERLHPEAKVNTFLQRGF